MTPSIPMLQYCNIKTGKIDSNAATDDGEYPFFTCSPETLRINKYAFDENAVLLAGNNASGVFPVKYFSGKFNAYQRTYILTSKDENQLATRYLYYVLRLQLANLQNLSTGVATKFLTIGILKQIHIPVPNIVEQGKIVACLSAYDDLIATNQRRIALLEEAARRLYREWFVHLRFPGHEQVAVKDGVPQGWSKLPLSELAEITMGQSPESKHYNSDGDGLAFHQGVSDFGHRFVKHETYTRQSTRIAEAGDILCSVRAPVGRLNLTRDKIAIGRGLSAMRSRVGHQSLLLYQLDALFVVEDMIGGGAIFASVGKKELFGQQILQSSASIAAMFNRLAADFDAQIETLDSQNRELAKARDLLLPKLMSGQMDVSGIRLPQHRILED